MNGALKAGGTAVGVVGAVVCVVAGLGRVVGSFWVGDFQVMTLFNVGVGLMVAGSFAILVAKRD